MTDTFRETLVERAKECRRNADNARTPEERDYYLMLLDTTVVDIMETDHPYLEVQILSVLAGLAAVIVCSLLWALS